MMVRIFNDGTDIQRIFYSICQHYNRVLHFIFIGHMNAQQLEYIAEYAIVRIMQNPR